MKINYLKFNSYLLFLALSLSSYSCSHKEMDDSISLSTTKNLKFTNTTALKDFVESGSFIGVGIVDGVPNPVILPGQSVEFSFSAANKQYLSLATMYGASKDWFFASKDTGIKLFDDDGKPITGDVSNSIFLWDNGTKDDITGEPEHNVIKQVDGVVSSRLLKASLAFDKNKSIFTLKITNTSAGTGNETSFSPGVWAISNFDEKDLINKKPLFEENQFTNPEITDIAQMGDITKMKAKLDENTGIITNISKAIAVVYEGNENPIYTINTLDKGKGLKELSQKGDTEKLEKYLKTLSNVKNVYVTSDGIAPNGSQSIKVNINNNEKLTFVTMFAYSNDWFLSSSAPIDVSTTGNISNLKILDSGTGVNEYPGAGNHQALFGGTPIEETEKIMEVRNSEYPLLKSADNYLKVTVD